MIGEKQGIKIVKENYKRKMPNLLRFLFYENQENLLATICFNEKEGRQKVNYTGTDGSFMNLIEIIEAAKQIENPKKETLKIIEYSSIFDPIGARRLAKYIEN